MIDTALKNTAAVTMGRNLNAVGSYCIVYELEPTLVHDPTSERVTNLIILWRQFVQALLNDMIPIQVLDEHHNVQTERDNDRVNLAMVSMISLCPTATLSVDRRENNYKLCLPVSASTESRSSFGLL